MKLLFWNINRKPLAGEIKSLCDFYDVDILILADNILQEAEILPVLRHHEQRIYRSSKTRRRLVDWLD